MAVKIPSGFQITADEAIDNRLVLSKEEMLLTKSARMPDVYLTVCSDDGKLYLYNKDNEIDPETGRFREVNIEAKEEAERALEEIQQLDDSLANVSKTGNVKDLVQDENDFLILNCNNWGE